MANILSDIQTYTDKYINLNLISGIAVGTSVIIQNKKLGAVWLQVSDSQPDPDSTDGYQLTSDQFCLIEEETNAIWVRSEYRNRIYIQVLG